MFGPEYELVGRINSLGKDVDTLTVGERVGVPWLCYTCSVCPYCRIDAQKLRDRMLFHRPRPRCRLRDRCRRNARYAFPHGEDREVVALAPLLSTGLTGMRSLDRISEAKRIGLYGFSVSAHIVAQLLACRDRLLYDVTKSGDLTTQPVRRSLDTFWPSHSD